MMTKTPVLNLVIQAETVQRTLLVAATVSLFTAISYFIGQFWCYSN